MFGGVGMGQVARMPSPRLPRRLRGCPRRVWAGLAGVAQSVAHLSCKQGVEGSSPFASSRVDLVSKPLSCDDVCDHARRLPWGQEWSRMDTRSQRYRTDIARTAARDRCVMSGRKPPTGLRLRAKAALRAVAGELRGSRPASGERRRTPSTPRPMPRGGSAGERQKIVVGELAAAEPPARAAVVTFDRLRDSQWLGSVTSSRGPGRGTSTCCSKYLVPVLGRLAHRRHHA